MMSDPDFRVNGRFLGQPVTGVQRYALQVVRTLNEELASGQSSAPILAPRNTIDPQLSAMPLQSGGRFTGHAWEQLSLPSLWRGRLLNLCNTAPATKADQIVCVHDASVFTAPESYSAAFRTVYRRLQPMLVKRSARITTVSYDSARQISRHLPISAADIVVLPNGHEHALAWDPARAGHVVTVVADMRARDRAYVLAIGSRARHKNLRLLAEIAPQLSAMGLDVVIAGGAGNVFADDGLPAPPSVRMLGKVSDDDLAYLMEHACCLVFPSWTEGFGLPIVEAMARGLPVVSSDRASMPEVCGDACLMAAPDDPASWIKHIKALHESADLRRDLSGRGSERARLFSWKDTGQGYLELMREPGRRVVRAVEERNLPRMAVLIATLGRPTVVTDTVRHLLATQSVKPELVILSVSKHEDAGEAATFPGVRVIVGPAGLPAQRNAALEALPPGIDVIAFFDDDFVAEAGWLAAAARTFRDEPDVVGFTGLVLADGIKGPGLSFADAVTTTARSDFRARWSRKDPYSPYGCNMAFRVSAIGDLRFDERLVLYGWLEDRDFGASLAKRGGRLIKSADARGVHMGVKGGRVSGDRLGYSQVVNPLYMMRKGTMTVMQVADHIFRNVASNLAGSLKSEPFIDRRGRLRGNLIGLKDVMLGKLRPERAKELGPRRPA